MLKFSLFTVFIVFISARGWVINNIDYDKLEARLALDWDNSIDKDDFLLPEERISLIYPGTKRDIQILFSLDSLIVSDFTCKI